MSHMKVGAGRIELPTVRISAGYSTTELHANKKYHCRGLLNLSISPDFRIGIPKCVSVFFHPECNGIHQIFLTSFYRTTKCFLKRRNLSWESFFFSRCFGIIFPNGIKQFSFITFIGTQDCKSSCESFSPALAASHKCRSRFIAKFSVVPACSLHMAELEKHW